MRDSNLCFSLMVGALQPIRMSREMFLDGFNSKISHEMLVEVAVTILLGLLLHAYHL